MKVILLQDVTNAGKLGDVVDVANGYARYLIRFCVAMRATADALKEFQTKEAEYVARQNTVLAVAKDRGAKVEGQVFSVSARAGVDGKLFGSVTALDIVDAIRKTGVEIKKSEVSLPHGPLKTIGEFEVTLLLHHDVRVVAKVNVVAES